MYNGTPGDVARRCDSNSGASQQLIAGRAGSYLSFNINWHVWGITIYVRLNFEPGKVGRCDSNSGARQQLIAGRAVSYLPSTSFLSFLSKWKIPMSTSNFFLLFSPVLWAGQSATYFSPTSLLNLKFSFDLSQTCQQL